EVAISNFTTTVTVNTNHVSLKPFQLSLNGAPVSASAELDLGVPGYVYDVAMSGDKIPVEPLANSFTTNAHGVHQGQILLDAKIKGAGIRGTNRKKNLGGTGGITVTNAALQILGPKAKAIPTPIAFVLGLPDLLQAPPTWVGVQAEAGQGKIQLKQCTAYS